MRETMHWKETFVVRSYEIESRGGLRLDALCNYLQESAGAHARELGVAVDQLLRRQATWVLSRLHVQIDSLPRWRQRVEITTWPAEVDRRYAVRDFLLEVEGKRFGAATTGWFYIDLQKRRPVRLPDAIARFHPDPPQRALQDPFAKLPVPQRSDHETSVRVQYRDLDLNRHTNNVSYISFLLESLPLDFLENHAPRELEVDFRAESVHGETLLCRSERQETAAGVRYVHQIVLQADGRELCRGVTRWAPR